MVAVFLPTLRVSVSCGAGGRCPKACGSTQSRTVPGHWQGNNGPAVGMPTLFCYSVPGRHVSRQSPGLSVWLSLPLLVGRSQAECVCVCAVSHLSASPSKVGQKVQQCIEMIWKKEVNRGEDVSDEPMERKLDVRFIQGSM